LIFFAHMNVPAGSNISPMEAIADEHASGPISQGFLNRRTAAAIAAGEFRDAHG
jgi:hypothetical protein